MMLKTFAAAAGRVATLLALAGCAPMALSQSSHPLLTLEKTIELPAVKGRIDHLAVDLTHKKLFVAELGNGTVEAIDLVSGKIAGRISGLGEPQGLGYLADRDELIVASGDGFVRFYRGDTLAPAGELKLGDDADNVRIDPATRKVTATITLPAHPESFRIDAAHHRAFVNLPGAGKIAVTDLATATVTSLRPAAYAANYPLLFDPGASGVAVVYRLPSHLVISDAETGKTRQDIDTCADSDDLFLDALRHRIYVSCGSGDIDVLEASADGYKRAARIKTRSGARASLHRAS